ncbi:MAG: hypothetical protein NTW62_02945 [Candidatus Nomurabacteria bacterium]|nr:hypothetical protein [Candidatus Nomurabacteria bacterium]
MKIKNIKKNKAFVLLFAIILASIIFAISIGIANISYKEVLLTTSGKNGNDAFFASDIGIECALYLDNVLASSSPFLSTGLNYEFGNTNFSDRACAGLPVNYTSTDFSGAVNFNVTNDNGCAAVSVLREVNASTTITSKGFNAGDLNNCPSGNNIVERELQVTY